jgi:hypothetical protein
LALEAESREAAAAAAAVDEEVDPTELRGAEQEDNEERSAEGRGVWMAAEAFAMAVQRGANWARGKERVAAIRAERGGDS